MNIFFLDANAYGSAQSLCDKHVVKMILESIQLLSSAHHLHPIDNVRQKLVKLTHQNHPSAIWCRSHKENYVYLTVYTQALMMEYSYRYSGKVHSMTGLFSWLDLHIPDIPELDETKLIKLGSWYITKPPQCMPDEYKQDDTIEAYRDYYKHGKRVDKNGKNMMVYTRRYPPEWLSSEINFSEMNNKFRADLPKESIV